MLCKVKQIITLTDVTEITITRLAMRLKYFCFNKIQAVKQENASQLCTMFLLLVVFVSQDSSSVKTRVNCCVLLSEGLLNVIVYSAPDDPKKFNRGFAFLDYDSHKSASAARRTIASTRMHVWGSEVIVEWAEPQEEPDEETMSKVLECVL